MLGLFFAKKRRKNEMNLQLKTAIFASGQTQSKIARVADISESRLSRLIRGYGVPKNEEKKRIATALRLRQKDLF
jgi:transcriptional regulator with XRE-family HTH domain